MRKHTSLIIVLIILSFLLPTSCSGTNITETVTQTQTVTLPPVTETVTTQPSITETTFPPITFTGSKVDKETLPFIVTTNEWIIDWSYVPDAKYSFYADFRFFVYPRGETESFVESLIFPSSYIGTTYSCAGAGEYHLDVTAIRVKSWRITIRPS